MDNGELKIWIQEYLRLRFSLFSHLSFAHCFHISMNPAAHSIAGDCEHPFVAARSTTMPLINAPVPLLSGRRLKNSPWRGRAVRRGADSMASAMMRAPMAAPENQRRRLRSGRLDRGERHDQERGGFRESNQE
jgi:hypothetical protein